VKSWNAQKITLAERLAGGRRYASGKTIEVVDLPNFLEAVIRAADRVCLEGDNQKQADVLAAALTDVDPAKIHDLHMVESGVVLPEHLDVFEKSIARAGSIIPIPAAVGTHRQDAVRRQNRAGGGAHLS
jgi:malonate decarboxylase alpha subunit